MNKGFLFLVTIALMLGNNAMAKCGVAVGGPNLKTVASNKLTVELDKMFITHKEVKVIVFPIASLSEAVRWEADYLVYLSGYEGNVKVQFRNLLTTEVMLEKYYSPALSLDTATQFIVKDIERFIVPMLPDYCR